MTKLGVLFSVLGVGAGCIPAFAQKQLPNIIVMLSDDQGWGDLGFTGNTFVQTPNIDRIAHEGTILENFYVCPVSSPTRAEFLTGRYHVRSCVNSTTGGGERFNLGEKTIAEYFREAGYATSLFGKWHSGTQYPYHPNARGFEEFYGFCSGHWGNYWNPVLEHNGEIISGEGFIIDDLTDKALDYIRDHKEHPFFMFLSYNTPHSPMQVPDSWWNRVKDRTLSQRATFPEQEDTTFTKAALALAENLDWNIGRVLSLLHSLDLEQETIVIYFSDNGPNSFRWNGGMKGRKGSTDEGGVRSPFCIRWPGHIRKGAVETQLSGAIDLIPTLLGLAGIEYTPLRKLDGIDWGQRLLDEKAPAIDRVLYSYWGGKTSVRISYYLLDAEDHLYKTDIDRAQRKDVSDKEPEIYERMKRYSNWFKDELLADFPKKDTRPFIIGHPQETYSKLPARDARISGPIERSNRYPNCSYFTNWKSPEAEISWNVEVEESGLFEAFIYYTCDKRNIGSTFELRTDRDAENLVFTLDQVNDQPMLGADLDRVLREESYVKGFAPCSVGTIPLSKGTATLSLQAKTIRNEEAMNFWMLVLKRVK
ncbi:arylsulfatase [Parabacteroides distasonis]|jgi:arylsulfatase A-like enzyme|uniref:arylsulfatase n=1 Tax=Parabacteroides distasonis TaxID=823 RepID=UPI0034A4C505